MPLETSLPDLPFTNHGIANVRPYYGTVSSSRSSAQTFPRTDLVDLRNWDTFPGIIDNAIRTAMKTLNISPIPFHIDALTTASFVVNEENLRGFVSYALLTPVEAVLRRLGVNGWLARAASAAIVGSPDFSWVVEGPGVQHPKLSVRVPAPLVRSLLNLAGVG